MAKVESKRTGAKDLFGRPIYFGDTVVYAVREACRVVLRVGTAAHFLPKENTQAVVTVDRNHLPRIDLVLDPTSMLAIVSNVFEEDLQWPYTNTNAENAEK